MTNERVPTCEKDGDDGWIITVERGNPVRVSDRALANQIWQLATWAYHNGRDDRMAIIREALGVNNV